MSGQAIVVVFTRFPEPGRVKTRLIGPITAEQAAELHRRCLALTLSTVSAVDDLRVVLAGTPDDADFSGIAPGFDTMAQGPGDLGERLHRATEAAFLNAQKVLLVGSDCPVLQPSDLARAVRMLDHCDVVIGPATDGGYYLLGLRRACRALFQGIDWGTSKVFDQTHRQAADASLEVQLLGPRRDLDTIDDVDELLHEIADDDARLGDFKIFLKSLGTA